MDIRSLHLVLDGATLNRLLARVIRDAKDVREVEAVFESGKLWLKAEVKVPASVPLLGGKWTSLRTCWQLEVVDGKLSTELVAAEIPGLGFGGGDWMSGALLELVRNAVSGRPHIAVEGRAIRLDLDKLLGAALESPIHLNLRRIDITPDAIELQAGA
ncbi:MAG: hypothetical protein A3K19_06375 [Lentisphaerae bacterium RIFOXYB12_FULL_65_16]|nr:MAG: hypothetical protein A3K18_28635 [Lentisphaerae bacterium RIFOXYA12_64_32]OGV93789.1 MAG: hypothetical protein A3K19_06375 [Lentisphaerae bacterium RIFOXYB12_FULL_65_16]